MGIDFVVTLSKSKVREYLKNSSRDVLNGLMLGDCDVESLIGNNVAILNKGVVMVISNPTILVDKRRGIVLKKGTYNGMRCAYIDMYKNVKESNYLLLVELPCNRILVERIWSDDTDYISKLLNVIIDKRG